MAEAKKVILPQSLRLLTMKTKINKAITEANLPAWVIVEAIESIYKDVKSQSEAEIKADVEQYTKALSEKTEDESSDGETESNKDADANE